MGLDVVGIVLSAQRIEPIKRSAAVLVALLTLPATLSAEPITKDKITVIDADTVRIDNESVRLVGFDAPETTVGKFRCDAERERGQRAAKQLEEILDSGTLDIRHRKHRDRYNRRLALLKVDGQNVGKTLIRDHLAVRYPGYGPKMDWCPRYRGR